MAKSSWKRRVGRVTVYARGQRYWVYYRQGKVIRRPVGSNRGDALTLAARINTELAEGAPTSLACKPIDLTALARSWLDHHENVRRSSLATIRRYRTAVQHLLNFAEEEAGGLRTDRVTQAMAESFVRYLRTVSISSNGHENTVKRRMRDKGVVFVLGACRSLFSYAAEHRHLPPYVPNPLSKLGLERMPFEDAKPIQPLTAEQERAFFDACDDFQFSIFFTLAYTGLRVGELTHLLIDRDVDFDAGVLRVTSKPGLCWQVKTRSEREIPMLPEVEEVVRECVGNRRTSPVFVRRRFASGLDVPPLAGHSIRQLETELVSRCPPDRDRTQRAATARVIWRDAGAIRESRVRTEFMTVTRSVGLRNLTCPKDLRHFFATSLQAAGVDPMVRRDLMGHTSLEMTSRYTHTSTETRRNGVKKLEIRLRSPRITNRS